MNKGFKLRDLRWFLSLGKKFVRVAPLRTLLVVLLTLVGQVAYILSFFLPLKIVILLGSDGTPRYFPASFAQIDRDLLIVYLSVATIGFFLLNVVTEKLTDYVSGGASASLMNRSQKLVLFEKQEEIAASAYQSFSRALAGLVFGGLTIMALSFVYPDMAWVMGGYLSAVVIALFALTAKSEGFRTYVRRNLGTMLNNLSAAGFFLVFGFLVLDFVLFEPPGIIFAVISILAGRQTFSRVAGAVKGLFRLYAQRQKLNVLFFHGLVMEYSKSSAKLSFLEQLRPDLRKEWVAKVLRAAGANFPDYNTKYLESVWLQPPIAGAAALNVSVEGQPFLIKLYDRNRSVGPQHEATLLLDELPGLPAPAFLGTTQVNGYPCSIMKLPTGCVASSRNKRREDRELLLKIYSFVPPSRIVQRFLRSRKTLYSRMSRDWLSLASVAVSDAEQKNALDALDRHWDDMKILIESVPLSLFNPMTQSSAVWLGEDGSKLALFWERWSLEPIGAGWPAGPSTLNSLNFQYNKLAAERADVANIVPEQIILSALLFELERLVSKEQFEFACKLLPRLWSVLNDLVANDKAIGVESNQ